MLPRRLRLPLVALTLAALACQPSNPPAPKTAPKVEAKATPEANPTPVSPTPPVATPTPPPKNEPVATSGEGPTIKVLDAGAEPREPLRLALQAGQTQAMTMTMRMAMSMELGGKSLPKTAIPPVQMTMNLTVKEITPEGDIRSEFVLTEMDVLPDPSAMPGVADQMKTMLSGMRNISGTSLISSRGIGKSAEFSLPKDLNPQIQQTIDSMRQQINQLSVPFPEEALGVGARWTVTQHLDQQGMKLDQVATWELRERSGSAVKLGNTLLQTAAPQAISAPGLPPGATVLLDALDSTGKGDVEVDLSKLAPIKSTADLSMNMRTTTEMLGTKTGMSMGMTLGLEIVGK